MDLPFDIISTDFDGTLFAGFQNPPVPLELQRLIGDLQGRGVKWVINTGRDLSSLMETLGRAALSIRPDYLVLVEREIYLHQQALYVPLVEWNTACTRDHAELFERIAPELPRLFEWINARFDATLYEDAFSPFCMIANSNGDADAIQAYLDEFCRGVPHLALMRNDVYARFSHDRYDKGTALAEISRRLRVPPARVFAAGDHLNDLPMLSNRYAAFLAAPANAIPQVKDEVRRQKGFLSPNNEGLGVAEALKHFLGGEV